MSDSIGKITEFFRRERKRLIAFVERRLADAADRDAYDLVQDVVTSMLARSNPAAEIENLSAYVYRALRNQIADAIEGRRKNVSLDTPFEDAEDDLKLMDILPSPEESQLDTLQRHQMEEAFEAALISLPARDRELIVANEFEGRTFRELAEESGEPIGTLLSRKSRAVAKLAVAMAEHKPDT
jgi:RNA polymerase sigma factor (sigma-70 family)